MTEAGASWGSAEEKVRKLRMAILVARYAYYVLARPTMLDSKYDELEDGLRKIEAAMPQFATPDSPTKIPGSDNPKDYPQSVRFYCENFLEGGRTCTRMEAMTR